MSDNPIPREALLSLPEVMRLTTLRQSAIYARMNAGTFPASRQVGLRKVAWPAGEVLDWIAALPTRRPGGKPAAPAQRNRSGDLREPDAASRSCEIDGRQGTPPLSPPRGRGRRATAT